MRLKKKLNLFWLAKKGVVRFKFWFVLKLFIIILWGCWFYNLYLLSDIKIFAVNNNIIKSLINYNFIFVNFLILLILLLITTFTSQIRKNEYGLYRCNGATRSEIILLFFNECLIMSIFFIVSILIIESFFLLHYKVEIIKLFQIKYNLKFVVRLLKGFGLTFLAIFAGLSISYLPFGLYYAFKDPYNIIRES